MIKLEVYLIFSNTLPSALLEYFAFKEVYGQKGLPQWGRGLGRSKKREIMMKCGKFQIESAIPVRQREPSRSLFWKLVDFGRETLSCAARTHLFRLINAQNGTLRALTIRPAKLHCNYPNDTYRKSPKNPYSEQNLRKCYSFSYFNNAFFAYGKSQTPIVGNILMDSMYCRVNIRRMFLYQM